MNNQNTKQLQKVIEIETSEHILIVWNNALRVSEDIEKYLNQYFQVVTKKKIRWTEEKFEENMSRFYGTKLPSIKDKVTHCGKGYFLLFIFKDNTPEMKIVETSSAPQLVNYRVFLAKKIFRDWLGGGHQIHASNNNWETARDLALLLDKKALAQVFDSKADGAIETDLVGTHGWDSLEQLFLTLNKSIDYVVLRNFDALMTTEKFDLHADIDFLVKDSDEAATLMNAKKVHRTKYRRHFTLLVDSQKVFIDLRAVGDNYYDRNWQNEILTSRVPFDCFYVPNQVNHYFSLLYHALVHKKNIAPDYIQAFNRLRYAPSEDDSCGFPHTNLLQELDSFMAINRFKYTRPDDLSVYFNTRLLNKPFREIDFQSKYSLPVHRKMREIIKRTLKELIEKLPYQLKVRLVALYQRRK